MNAHASNAVSLDDGMLADIEKRVQRFGVTGDPEQLWPGLVEGERVAAAREIERVTAMVLGSAPSVALDPAARHSRRAMAIAAHTTGMGPLFGHWAAHGVIHAGIHAEALNDHLAHSERRWRRMEAGLHPALDALRAEGITPLAMKGLHTATTLYPSPGTRRMSDIDLLIAPDECAQAGEALRSVGFVPFGRSEPHKQDWIGPGVSPRTHSLELSDEHTRWTLEVHTSLDSVFYRGAVARLDHLVTSARHLEIQGRRVRALGPDALVVLLACHASELDANRLLRVYELVIAARAGVDWTRVFGLLSATRIARYAWPAFFLAESLAPGCIDPRVLALGEQQSTWAARHTVHRLTAAGGRIGDLGLARHLMWTSGAQAMLERVKKLLWPGVSDSGKSAPGWRSRIHQWRRGRITFAAPDERPPGAEAIRQRARKTS